MRIGTTTRRGGCSAAPYASFNLGDHVGDDPAAVEENRRRLQAALPPACRPFWLAQHHGVRVVRAVAGDDSVPAADASWTCDRRVACAVLTADCLPVLLCSRDGAVVAAVHAGWRGLAAGVIEAAVTAMTDTPDALLAWLGPAIGPGAFEVGPEVREAFVEADSPAADCFVPASRKGHFLADLRGLARRRLAHMGIDAAAIVDDERCTYRDPATFYSHRRDGPTGRMASLILRG